MNGDAGVRPGAGVRPLAGVRSGPLAGVRSGPELLLLRGRLVIRAAGVLILPPLLWLELWGCRNAAAYGVPTSGV